MSVPPHLQSLRAAVPFLHWYASSRYLRRDPSIEIADFLFGNPHDLPMPKYVASLTHNAVPEDKDWFAYKLSEPEATKTVAMSLRERTGLDFSEQDIFMTNGGFAAIAVSLKALAGPGDEVIFLSPPWFFYEMLILSAGATPVRASLSPPRFDLDIDAIVRAITPRTRAVVINTPHNPSGRIYEDEVLAKLGSVLREASEKNGRPIWLLSDEAYCRIVYEGQRAPTPAAHYAYTMILYTYGKQLLSPGQRIGYVAICPAAKDAALNGDLTREELTEALTLAQFAGGFAFPNALLQRALSEIEPLCVDLGALERRRDRVVAELLRLGYEPICPEGTFYVLARSPDPDDLAFADRLAEANTYVLPGALVELPGWFRVSLTANDAMVERGLKTLAAFAPAQK